MESDREAVIGSLKGARRTRLRPNDACPDPIGQPHLIGRIRPIIGGSLGAFNIRCHGAVHRKAYQIWLGRAPARGADAEALALRGRVHRLLGSRAEAARLFERALSLRPDCASALAWRWELDPSKGGLGRAVLAEPTVGWWRLMRGADALLRHRLGPARGDLEAASEAGDSSAMACALLALVHLGEGAPGRAVENLDQAIRLEGRFSWFYRLRAKAHIQRGDFRSASDDIDRLMVFEEASNDLASMVQPNAVPSLWTLIFRAARCPAKGEQDFKSALRDLERAVELSHERAWAWAYLARVRALAKQVGGREALDRAVGLSSECGWILAWRAELRRQEGDLEGAVADSSGAIGLAPYEPMAYATRGASLRGLGRLEESAEDLRIAVEMEPEHGWFHYEQMLLLKAQGRYCEAAEGLSRAQDFDGKFVWTRDPKDLPLAVQQLGEVIKRSPRFALSYAWRGEAHWRLGDAAAGLRDLDRAVVLGERRAGTFLWRGRILAGLGRAERALRDFDRAIRQAPREPEAYDEKARLLAGLGKDHEAWLVLRRAVARAKPSTRVRLLKAEVELRLGRPAAALADFEAVLAASPACGDPAFEALIGRISARLLLEPPQALKADIDFARSLRPNDAGLRAIQESIAASRVERRGASYAPPDRASGAESKRR